ncbi:MAG: hypothetical protein OEX12_12510, partial [Gammaproteobacteria bacterium]|nr:hypothetical protein [Gammaproteobacteria bacterium]
WDTVIRGNAVSLHAEVISGKGDPSKPASKILKEKEEKPTITSEAIALSEATYLYQKVKGTDNGSVYRVVGLGDNWNLACRYKENHSLSVRLEPRAGCSLGDLKYTGLNMSSKNHASAHFSVDSFYEAERAVGAVLMAVGQFTTPVPELSKILYKGS